MTKSRLLLAGITLLTAGCAINPGPIFIEKFFTVPATCVVKDDPTGQAALPYGTLDVAPYPAQYYVGVLIGGGLLPTQAVSVGPNAQEIEAAGRARVVVDEVVITYSSPKLKGFKEWKRGFALVFDETGGAYGPLSLISPEAADIIDSGISPSNDPHDRTRLDAIVTFNGYVTGSNSRVTTGPLTFPITLTRTEVVGCTTGISSAQTDPCESPGMGRTAPTANLVCCTVAGQPGCP